MLLFHFKTVFTFAILQMNKSKIKFKIKAAKDNYETVKKERVMEGARLMPTSC